MKTQNFSKLHSNISFKRFFKIVVVTFTSVYHHRVQQCSSRVVNVTFYNYSLWHFGSFFPYQHWLSVIICERITTPFRISISGEIHRGRKLSRQLWKTKTRYPLTLSLSSTVLIKVKNPFSTRISYTSLNEPKMGRYLIQWNGLFFSEATRRFPKVI